MEEFPNNENINQGEQETKPEEAVKSFEEHMEGVERDSSIGEKYYEQAKEEKARRIEEAQREIEKERALEPSNVRRIINEKLDLEELDMENHKDKEDFEAYKTGRISFAERELEKNENLDLDELAECFKNKEIIDGIAKKLKNNEEFTEEEIEFLDIAPGSVAAEQGIVDFRKYTTPEKYYTGDIFLVPYHAFLDREQFKGDDPWGVVGRAQIRELEKQGRLLVNEDENLQKYLGDMEENRNVSPFAGETNINSETGETRTFTPEDNYPRLEGESEDDYAKRLRSIGFKSRLAEKRQEQE